MKSDDYLNPAQSPYLVPSDDTFAVDQSITSPVAAKPDSHYTSLLKKQRNKLRKLQHLLYANNSRALLVIFQAIDAGGKDSTIRAVFRGVNPAGCRVYSFKQPSAEELAHDFLWRTTRRLPGKGFIGVFNRSYYEEVLIARVHPSILHAQKLPKISDYNEFWQQRYNAINHHERHLAQNGTVIVKFWLNISPDEQCRRFLSRLDHPEKYWKFNRRDVEERQHWNSYIRAYEAALSATSKPWGPWYAIPADNKPYARFCVAKILVKTLENMNLDFPSADRSSPRELDALRNELEKQLEHP